MACVGTGAALKETFKKGDIKTEPRYGTAQHEEALMKSLRPDTDQDSKAEKLDMLGHSKESSEAVMGEVKFKAAFRTSSVCVLCEQLGTIQAFIPVVYRRDSKLGKDETRSHI